MTNSNISDRIFNNTNNSKLLLYSQTDMQAEFY